MCGIFGWSLNEGKVSNTKRKALFDILALENDTRGGHSWGVYARGRDGQTPTTEHGLGDMFGHTRFATHGTHTVENAHPFTIGDIIGAHNGVLNNHFELNREHGRTFSVDSQHIFAHIDGGDDLKDLEGYGAIEWTRASAPDVIYVGTFDHYLAIFRLPYGAGIVWTSDASHGNKALKLTRLGGVRLDMTDRHVYEISKGECYKTDHRLNVSKATTKWDWRSGETGTGAVKYTEYKNGVAHTSYGYPGRKRYASAYLGATSADDIGGDDNCGGGGYNRKDLPPMETDEFEDHYCDKCYMEHDDCTCPDEDDPDFVPETPDTTCVCNGVIKRDPTDPEICYDCGLPLFEDGDIIDVDNAEPDPEDPAFAVQPGFNDHIER